MKELIREVFESGFNENQYTRFINELLVEFDRDKYFHRKTTFPDMYKGFVTSYSRLGTYQSPAGEKIDNLIVYLRNSHSIDAARNAQRNFVAHHLKMYDDKDAALVAFVSPGSPDWRFSLVKSTFENVRQESGQFKLTRLFSPAKRWSYLVGESERSHTAQSMFLPLIESKQKPELNDLIGAFDIESVTDEFFAGYKQLFFNVKEAVDLLITTDKLVATEFREKGISPVDFSKKLLGQVVFLYFLQKKGWLGVPEEGKWGNGSKRFLRDLFERKHVRYRNFFNDVLEHLFYEALASDRSVYDHFSTLFNCRLPFLNGGLFDPIGGYNWTQTHILLPDELFSNNERTKSGDTGTGILDVFDRYNFTVKEDEPLEKEVAVDPEMLGKVFENLLEVNDRKSTGTFYTPRSVVYYMCQESIVRYLEPHIQHAITDDDIRDFIRLADYSAENEAHLAEKGKETGTYKYQTPACIRNNAKLIDDLLSNIKVCDPAIGSGAFPVGILSEIVKLRMMLTPFLEEKDGRTAYNFKRHCIQNSIYGVDIAAGAVEIAKLRLWLSLVVDEDDVNEVKPLPNLDYKIVTGNSLLRMQEMLFESVDTETFENMKLTFFNETNTDRKKTEKEKIDKILAERSGGVNQFDFPLYFTEVFSGDNPGFDVVIGNPPYIPLQKLKGTPEHKLYQEQKFDTFEATGDIYCLFYERGLRITKRGHGVLCYITSNKWMRAGYGAKLRDMMIKHDPLILIDLSAIKVFKHATVDTNVIIIRNSKFGDNLNGAAFGATFRATDDIQDFLSGIQSKIELTVGESWSLGSADELKLKRKIETSGIALKDWDIAIYYGIKTGFNEAFFIDEETRKRLIAEDPKSAELIKPLIRGRDVGRYISYWSRTFLLATGFDENIKKEYPAIYSHLHDYKDKLEVRTDKGEAWYNLRACAYYDAFEKEKIAWSRLMRIHKKEMRSFPRFVLLDKGVYTTDSVCIITGKALHFFIGVLNSRFAEYFFSRNIAILDNGGMQMRQQYVENIPIPKITERNIALKAEIEHLVKQVIEKRKNTQDTTDLENRIDRLVYEMFDLTEDEIALIESKAGLVGE